MLSGTSAGLHAQEISPSCAAVGDIARTIARWRDSGGSARLANAQIASRVPDKAARQAALDIVTQLYTGVSKGMTPDVAKQAYSISCALAPRQDTQ